MFSRDFFQEWNPNNFPFIFLFFFSFTFRWTVSLLVLTAYLVFTYIEHLLKSLDSRHVKYIWFIDALSSISALTTPTKKISFYKEFGFGNQKSN